MPGTITVAPSQVTDLLAPAVLEKVIYLNQKRRYLQVTVVGGSVGTVSFKVRPLLEKLDETDAYQHMLDYPSVEFEDLTGLTIDLADATYQRTFVLSDRYLSALKVIRSAGGTGDIRIHVKQFTE